MTYQNPRTSSPRINPNSPNTSKLLPVSSLNLSPIDQPQPKLSGLSLRAKAILVAIALSVIPVTIIGAIAYRVTASHLGQQINQTEQDKSRHTAQMLEKLLKDCANEAKTLADSPIFTNPNVMATMTPSQKKLALDRFQDQTQFYDSIVYLDLQGNLLVQSQSEQPLNQNYRDRSYFQEAIQQKKTTLDEINISDLTGESRIEFAVPVTHAWTGEVIGVLGFCIPQEGLITLLEQNITSDQDWHLVNTQGTVFASSLPNLNNQTLANYFPSLQSAHVSKNLVTELVTSPSKPFQEQIINYVPIQLGAINPNLNLGVAIAMDTDVAFAPLKPLRWIYLGGTIGTALLVGSVAGFLANRIVQPLLQLTAAVDQLTRGKLHTRIKLDTQDELALLGNQINQMAEQLDLAMQRQQTVTRTSELLARISQARDSRELQLPFSLFLGEVRKVLKTDRVVFYQFDRQWNGTVIAESVAQEFPRTLGVQFDDPCFAQEYIRKYQRGRIQAIADIYQANLTRCHLQQLEPYQVKASLVLPVILEYSRLPESERLIGLLITHQCSQTKVWSQSDVDYLQQIAYQLAMVLRGYAIQSQDKLQKIEIEKNLAQVVRGMKEVAQGNLRADLADGSKPESEVHTSFQEILQRLRQMVSQFQTPSRQIDRELTVSRQSVTDLKDHLKQQANQLVLIFAFIEQMSNLIAEVSSQAGTASHTVDQVVTDLESEKINFQHAIAFMSKLETSLKNNTDKVKNLSHAADKMTKVIGSIRKINLRASLLASKLSKRIPELDESAFGLKEEIKSIQQSIAATKELENVVQNIEREINEVLRDYQKGENRLEEENYLVANASQNLEQIVRITKNAQQHLFSLVNMTNIQLQTSQKINQLKDELNETSVSIIAMSDRALHSLDETSITAKDLRNVVEFFKLE